MLRYTTKRLNLVMIERRHLDHLLQLWTDPQVMSNVGFPLGLHPDDIDLESYLSDAEEIAPTGRIRGIHMAVELKDGTLIGEAKIASPDEQGMSEPDVKLLPDYWGRSLGTEIVKLLIDECFSLYPDCQAVQFTPNIENTSAIRLYCGLGSEVVGDGFFPPEASSLRGFAGVSYLVMQTCREVWEENKRDVLRQEKVNSVSGP